MRRALYLSPKRNFNSPVFFSAYVLNYFLDRMKVKADMGLDDKLEKAFFMICICREVAKA